MPIRMSESEFKRLARGVGRKAKPSKYGNVRTEYNGVKYDSKAEAARAELLDNLRAAGHIRFWLAQPKFRLGVPENVYIADFLVIDSAGRHWVEDVKGRSTAKFKHDVRLWKKYGPCDLHILRGDKQSDELIKGGEPK